MTTANLQGNLTHNQSIIDAAGNVSSFAKGQQTLDHTNITSQANIQIQANSDLIVNNSQINSAKHTTIYVQGNQTTTNSTLIAKGIVSDVVRVIIVLTVMAPTKAVLSCLTVQALP